MDENNSNINFQPSLSTSMDCTSGSHLNEIVVEIIQEGTNKKINDIFRDNKSIRKRTKSKLGSHACAGYALATSEKPITPKVKPQLIDREPGKELLETWREALQKSRQVCCPHPDCQLSYCSIRGLILHYRACNGKRNDEEIVKCKICCNYVSGRISLAHHNRLLHSGMPTKAINSFMESQSESKRSSFNTTKSRRLVRKPARYREPQDVKEDANKQDDFIQNLSPVTTANEKKLSKPCATITRLPSGSFNKQDFPEAVLKSSFLYRMGLAPTDLASNVVVLEEETEDKLPLPLPDDAFKLPTDVCNNIRANYTQFYQRTKPNKVDLVEPLVIPDVPPVKRKRGRPRKEKVKISEPIVNSESQKSEDKSSKRKRRRKHLEKSPETNEFLSVTACGLCWEEFKDQVSCDKHVATKHGTQGPLDTEKLLMKEQKAKLQKMMRQHGILTCPNQNCKKPLLSITGYLNHIKNCKQELPLIESRNSESREISFENLITCRECKATFEREDGFENHALAHHHGLARVVGDERPFTEDDRIMAQKKMLKQYGQIPCPNCPKQYLSIQGLQYHLRTCKSTTNQEVVCNYCRILFTNLQTFREHVIARHNGLALPVGDERIYNSEEKAKILQQVLRLNQKLLCLNEGCPEEFKIVENYISHEETCIKAKPLHKIECGICKQKFNTQPQFNNHAMIAHNGLARINGSNQIFTEDEKVQALKKTLQVLKRLHCLREDCGKTFTSLGGYQYHLKNCGQESISIQCSICGKRLKEASMKTHMKMTHPPSPPPPPPKQEVLEISEKRPAAKRAREKVSEIAKKYFREDHSNEITKNSLSESEDSTYELPDINKAYTKPSQSISSQTYSDWRKQFDCNGKSSCTNTGCSQEFATLTDLKRHFILCKFSTLQLCYVCNICQKKCRGESQMQNHMIKSHSYGDVNISDSEQDDSSSNHGQSGYGKYSTSSIRSGQDFEPLYQAADWTYNYCKRNYDNLLFSNFFPEISNWKRLSELEYKQYLPEESTSISFQVIDGVKKENPSSVWHKLNRFACKAQSDTAQVNPCTMFTGGPVWAMAWCPTPANKVCDQYLALSSHQLMEERVQVLPCMNKPGLIQIWQIGNASDLSTSLESKFVLGIVHDYGVIWKLEWCPSGCWNDENNNDITLPRLGLLASACSNGKIYIFGVPTPESLPTANGLPIYHVKPTIILQLESLSDFNCDNRRTIESQCLTLSWQRHKGHANIAGGFANGFVAIWNTETDSDLLRKKDSDLTNLEICFSPYKTFKAHADCVKDVVWAPFSNGNFLATIGWDRQVQVWSIDDTSLPINSQKLGKLLSIAWSPYWCGVFVTQEECYNLWRTNLRFVDTGYFGNGSRCLTAHNGSIWQVSVNDWLNCTATCDSNGEVVGTVLTQLLYGVQNLKNLSRRRFPIYRTNICNLKSEDVDTNNEEAKNKSVINPVENSIENPLKNLDHDETDSCDSALTVNNTKSSTPGSYKEAANDYGIVFVDNVPISAKLFPSDEISRLGNANTMTASELTFPIVSINKVAWNPNLGSHLLVASGGNSGLIRIHKIHWLHQANVEKLRAKLQMCKDECENNVNKISVKIPDIENTIENPCEVIESNCISPIKPSAIGWLKKANIEKIRSGLHAHTANIQHENETNEKAKSENLDTSSSSSDKTRVIINQFQS